MLKIWDFIAPDVTGKYWFDGKIFTQDLRHVEYVIKDDVVEVNMLDGNLVMWLTGDAIPIKLSRVSGMWYGPIYAPCKNLQKLDNFV